MFNDCGMDWGCFHWDVCCQVNISIEFVKLVPLVVWESNSLSNSSNVLKILNIYRYMCVFAHRRTYYKQVMNTYRCLLCVYISRWVMPVVWPITIDVCFIPTWMNLKFRSVDKVLYFCGSPDAYRMELSSILVYLSL